MASLPKELRKQLESAVKKARRESEAEARKALKGLAVAHHEPWPSMSKAERACKLRSTPNIKWTKDRGKEPDRPKDDFPWFWGWDENTPDFPGGRTFDGNRWNGVHYTRPFKEAARKRLKETKR